MRVVAELLSWQQNEVEVVGEWEGHTLAAVGKLLPRQVLPTVRYTLTATKWPATSTLIYISWPPLSTSTPVSTPCHRLSPALPFTVNWYCPSSSRLRLSNSN